MFHGLCRALAPTPSSASPTGFQKQLEIVGVGYKAKLDKDKLELSLGYSKPNLYPTSPRTSRSSCEKPTLLTVRGIDKQRVGQGRGRHQALPQARPVQAQRASATSARSSIKKERKAGVTGA